MSSLKKQLYIKTYGCQMNVYDSDRMTDLLTPLGYESVDQPDNADMVILNTCHIREKATEKVFSELGRLKRHKDKRAKNGNDTIIAVAGCVAQAEGDEITRRAPLCGYGVWSTNLSPSARNDRSSHPLHWRGIRR